VTEATFDRLLSRHDLSPSLVPRLVEAYHESPTEMRLTPHPDARPTLDRLADDYALGVVTDGRNGRSKLDVLGLDAYFETVVVTPEHDLSKRDERAFRLALDDLDVEPTRTAYVGDNPATDFREPNRLGMRTIRIRRGRYRDRTPEDGARPDDVIDSLDRLPTLLEPNPHP
jgi:putative hydrolase of the HAD superfamily